ncbi:MAG: hypothetical protein JZU65_22585, partial [Chlorobium sp.]|nr:hypothetical protein [Chlorobium sp.]
MNSTKGVESRWLLIEHGIDREGCVKLISDAGLIVPPKSGCWFCPFQRKGQWTRLRREHPELYCKAQKLEARSMEDYKARKGRPG